MAHGAARPIGAEAARLDDRHLDAEMLHFLGERFRNAFERELAAVVGGNAGEGHEPAHRADVEDVAGAAAAQIGQGRLHHGDGAEDVHLELLTEIIECRFFKRTLETIAGIVDEHFDAAELFFGFFDAAMDRGLVGDVEQDAERAARRKLFELGFVRVLTHGAGDFAALFEDQFRQRTAEAAADAGDEPIHGELLIENRRSDAGRKALRAWRSPPP